MINPALSSELVERFGNVPYTELTSDERIQLVQSSLGDLMKVIDVASSVQPPNYTTLAAISATCITRATMLGEHRAAMPLMVNRDASQTFPGR